MRTLNKTWQEAIALASECKIIKAELPGPNVLEITLKDPAGQVFKLQITSLATTGFVGNLLAVNSSFDIKALAED